MTTPLADLFAILYQSQQANQQALDQVGRVQYPTLCTVSNNDDPQNLRRIRVADPSRPGLESDWLLRLQPFPYLDPPLPAIGQTVICLFEDGKESSGWYLTCMNTTNPAMGKESPQNDWWCEVPGHRTEKVGGKRETTIAETDTTEVGSDLTLTVKGTSETEVSLAYLMHGKTSVTVSNEAGASITLLPSGAVVLQSSSGATLTLGGGSGGSAQDITWDLNGRALNIINTPSVSILGKQVATIGALDTASEALVTKGW